MKWFQQIQSHYEKAWGTAAEVRKLARGPVHELPRDFAVLVFAPHGNRDMWTYATCCMSNPEDSKPLELHIFSRSACEALIELLTVTAHFHRTGASLDLWHTVNFGRPWEGNSQCDHGLISLPYLDGPQLENLSAGNTITAKCYWLVPITQYEVEFKKQQGVEALEQKFEQQSFDYLDPNRRSVV